MDNLLVYPLLCELFPKPQNFRLCQTDRVCRQTISNLIKNDRKFSKAVGNTVGKGQLARNAV